jgi:NAD(P)-dependent dehydrogenase (short-subunit alcohol dehydrogenase family)
MSKTSPVILIFGAGPNVGQHVARSFASKGYRVALAARRAKEADNSSDQINVATDLSDPSSVVNTFLEVKRLLGIPPSVVVYNGKNHYQKLCGTFTEYFEAGAVTPNDAKNPLSLPLADFSRDFNINTTSAFVAAQQAVLGFEKLPESASRTFIYTGNILNTMFIIPPLLDLGVGKSATAHIIQSAAAAYKDRGYKYELSSQSHS